jgi:hypothetical protein
MQTAFPNATEDTIISVPNKDYFVKLSALLREKDEKWASMISYFA